MTHFITSQKVLAYFLLYLDILEVNLFLLQSSPTITLKMNLMDSVAFPYWFKNFIFLLYPFIIRIFCLLKAFFSFFVYIKFFLHLVI